MFLGFGSFTSRSNSLKSRVLRWLRRTGSELPCLSRTNSATSEGISNLWAYFETPPNVDLSEKRIESCTPFAAIRGLKMNANKYMKKSIIMRSIWGVSQASPVFLGSGSIGSTMQNPLVFWNDVNRCDVPWVCITARSLYLLPGQ